ncbi:MULTISPECIES: hypothetical protein [unclassified Brevibacterium]|uniref:hypothetical protein n=1 Tax=unclassified Brevibacterium TaxID=2614124 RepID=UPI0010920996|nr:hypothetical protein [Brevibacterium sp. S22]TGD28675.1 hypothetical protein EB835_17060 [Brevibacterium sp. S22]
MTASENRPLTAEDLLASPRGRSLVFGLALRGRTDEFDDGAEPLTEEARALDEFRSAVFAAGSHIDRAQGLAVTVYLRADDSEVESEPELQLEPTNVRPVAVATQLRRVTPVTPTQADLENEMAEVITGAMYWQPPHGDDQIASDPVVREALRPFAENLIDTGLLDSWSRPLKTDDQWALAWDDAEHRGSLPAVFDLESDPADSSEEHPEITLTDLYPPDGGGEIRQPWGLGEWLADVLTTETRYRHDFAKNPYEEVSGEWWSTPPAGLWSSTATWPDGTPIGVELVEDDFGLNRARACRLRLNPDARIAEIRTPEDWADLCRRHPLDVTAGRRQVWFETTGRKGRWVIPDWSQVAEEFDGVHVGLSGYLRTAGVVIDVAQGHLGEESETMPTMGNTDDQTASLMAGWHPDTTFWLGDVIDTVAVVVEWHFDDDADRWVRG